ncbi:MAG: hypothetical protein HY788_20430 [Deltaproteobacteria bacterium]|nr:hypothetical protein [Deltaproteobacteria bacterium]
MAKEFFPNLREEKILSRLDSSKDHGRERLLQQIRSQVEDLSNRLAQRLLDTGLVATSNRRELVRQLELCLRQMVSAEDFEIEYQTAPFRTVVPVPNFVSLYLTAFIVEKLIDHQSVEEIYGTDEEIYKAVDSVVTRVGEAS